MNEETGGKTNASKSHLLAGKVMTRNELADKVFYLSCFEYLTTEIIFGF